MLFRTLIAILSFFAPRVVSTKKPEYQHLPPLREQAKIQDGWRQERLDSVPALLEKHGVDAWLLSQKEYAEDTAFWSMKQATQFSARRRTTYIFFAEHLVESKNCTFKSWIDITPAVWTELEHVLEACKPESIVVDTDSQIAFASGLHAGERDLIVGQLGPYWADKLVNKPIVPVEYIATMPKSRLKWYKRIMETAWAIIDEGFSERVITPGKTTTEDVEWWMREKIQALNYTTWFQPSVSILGPQTVIGPPNTPGARPIDYGDLLHVDFGVTAMGLNTDTQHLAYVLAPGDKEKDIPKGIVDGLKAGNRLQDLTRANMKIGLTGNQILKNILDDVHAEGLEGQIYSHPIGDWGHAAGPVIGMAFIQDGVPALGDLPLLKNMWYSVELFAEHHVPEKNATLKFFLEEDVYWNDEKESWEWVRGRQERFHLIKEDEASFKVQL
ncbi:hypothetical protein PRZ48_003378 [Zasmidium cellare]|uniref:Peptidase M24 domain-containing protein n=1 Tax=Zasmidium cellare TaxID=395010 RepID=A0ABR0EVF0_ZASCE|nr:hypothetical protein PRZ48_003378 [Zasmidium cellare]